MTIAIAQFDAVGARTYLPEGPYGAAGQTPLPGFKPGSVTSGDCEAEFTFLLFPVTASVTLNQGDLLVWDNSYNASQSSFVFATGGYPAGADVGTLYLGGRVGDPAAAPNGGNVWSYTFQPGVYGIWVQRAGTSLAKTGTITSQATQAVTTSTPSQVAYAAGATHYQNVNGIFSAPTSWSFTGTTTSGSATITGVSSCNGLVKGQTLSGTGVATGATITDIQGSTVTMSLAATASGSVTITAANNSTYVTTTTGSATLTNVTSIAGLYPNQTIAGTGIPGATTIVSIQGNPGNYSITMSAAATATANNINATTSGYLETFLRWPYLSSAAA
jgi:hypothetical protein